MGKEGKTKNGKSKARSSRAGLQFSVGRIHRLLRKGNYAECVDAGAAVMEYLAAEVLELETLPGTKIRISFQDFYSWQAEVIRN